MVVSQPTLTYAGARRVLDAAMAKAAAIGVTVNISVCDAAGHQVAFARMDGAALLAGSIATDKAFSVVAFQGAPTGDWHEKLEPNSAVRDGIVNRDRLIIFGGGVPVRVGRDVVGAVGVSGGSEAEDEEIAAAGSGALT